MSGIGRNNEHAGGIDMAGKIFVDGVLVQVLSYTAGWLEQVLPAHYMSTMAAPVMCLFG